MVTVPLVGGAYQARSPIANQQRCVNLYPEKNQEDAEVPVTHYQTPGLLALVNDGTPGAWRGLYKASNGTLYGVRGANVYAVATNWTLTLLGTIGSSSSTPVSMADNTLDMVIVDGSANGWSVHLATNAFAVITDPNFHGGNFVKYLNGFLILNVPGTQQIYSSGLFALTFNALDFAAKSGASDKLLGIEANHLELWLVGERTTEVWAANEGAGFPFIRVPGAFIEHGTVAAYSIARYDTDVFWLSQDNNGEALVLKGANYQVQNVTTPAISFIISRYAVISDAVGYVYQQGNHAFYVLNFPTANATWVYDMSTKEWHERAYVDANGAENRIRVNCTAFYNNMNIAGDNQNGKLYQWSESVFTDDGAPIVRRRGFPHLVKDGKLIYHREFAADISMGTAPAGVGTPSGELGVPAEAQLTSLISLRWSDDRGFSWGNPVMESLGATGEYGLFTTWQDLGMTRDRVYEVFWSEAADVALNGAYVDMQVLER